MSLSRVPVLWITGLSGVGKSTLARALVERIAHTGDAPALIDGDAVRHDAGDASMHGFDVDSRRARAWHIARRAHETALQAQPVIVATISLFDEVQRWNRAQHARFAEVLLLAPIAMLHARNPSLYGSRQPNVWGVDLAPHYPPHAELVLEQRFDDHATNLAQALALWQRL